jgi:hypothetical protein
MEIIVEILLALFRVIAEAVLQAVFEILAEFGLRSVREPFRRPKPLHPVLAATGYAIFGAIAGGLSLWLFPTLFIDAEWLRIVNLVVTPVAAGGVMALVGAWRRRRDQELIRLDRFSYGFLFALAMALVRFGWSH